MILRKLIVLDSISKYIHDESISNYGNHHTPSWEIVRDRRGEMNDDDDYVREIEFVALSSEEIRAMPL